MAFCQLGGLAAPSARLAATVAASGASGEPKRRRRRPTLPPAPPGPSVSEVRRAIGVADDTLPSENSGFMEFLAKTPIGQPESAVERRLREAAEWFVEKTEAPALDGQRALIMLCVKVIFPLWVFLLFVAVGVIKLPFDIPYLDDILIFNYLVIPIKVLHHKLSFVPDKTGIGSLNFMIFEFFLDWVK